MAVPLCVPALPYRPTYLCIIFGLGADKVVAVAEENGAEANGALAGRRKVKRLLL